MEPWDIYDENRIPTGRSMVRGEPTADGDYRLVIHVCIFNDKGEMLIQQRQSFKKGWSNLWDVSVGGHAVKGDSSRAAAEREVFEELGLKINLEAVRPRFTVNFKNGFDDFYCIEQNVEISQLKLQYEEVQGAKWAAKDEIIQMIDDEIFIPYHKSLIDMLFWFRKNIGTHDMNQGSDVS